VDDQRIGAAFRAIRLRKGLRQSDVGKLAGVSRWVVARIERGRLREVSLSAFRRVAEGLDAYIEIRVRWEGADLDRLMNSRHSALHEVVARRFTALDGWTMSPEVSYSIYGERGVIDVMAWHAATRTLLVVELKTLLVDVNDLMGSMDRRRRLATRMARERGWFPILVSAWVAVADTSTNHRRLRDHAAVLRTAFPDDGRRLRRWLPQPNGSVAVLSFLSAATPSGRKHDFRPIRQVRRPRSARSTHDPHQDREPESPKLRHRP
jgi:transcriptional regulator with XRE-family HTH domain